MQRFLISILIILLTPAVIFAKEDAFQTALQNADARIHAFDQALQTGDSRSIRSAALELQKDPLAVRRVNENRTPEFKTQLNQELDSIKTETRARVRRQIAEKYQVPEEDVTFFEATNPSDEIKVGQDWDVTAQVQGKDIPFEVTTQIVHDSYFEAANGRAPATPQEASRFAHQQAVEVTNRSHAEAYGGGGRRAVVDPETGETRIMSEGGEIIAGDKSQPLRDSEQLTNVMRHKSELAKNQAEDIRAEAEEKIKSEGLSGEEAAAVRHQADADAQAWEMEQARQHIKQQDRQMQPRVEAMGGEVPRQVEAGNAILREVADGKISPQEGRRRLAEIGETPESIIEKGAGLHEAAQKLKSPQERITQAEALKASGRDDVLTSNVQERMELNQLERRAALKSQGLSDAEIDQRLARQPAESLEEVRARARNAGIDAPDGHLLDGGKSSFQRSSTPVERVGMGIEAMQAAGDAAEVYQQEAEAAAQEGREISGTNVAVEVGRRAAGGSEYDMSHKISSEEIAKSDAKGESRIWAFGRSVGENVRQRLGGGAYDMSQKINEEEAQKEVERAQAEGREASALNAKVNAATRIGGEMTGMTQIMDAAMYDDDADRQAAETQRKVQDKGKEKLQNGILKTGELEDRMNDLIENWDTSDPAIRAELDQLRGEYEKERSQLQEHLARMNESRVMNTDDPEYRALAQAASLVPEYSPERVQNKISDHARDRMQNALAELQCDKDRNTYPLWDDERGQAYCGCLQGQTPNAQGICAAPQPEKSPRDLAMENASCEHIALSEKVWNDATQSVDCACMFSDASVVMENGVFTCKSNILINSAQNGMGGNGVIPGSAARSLNPVRGSGPDMSAVVTGLTGILEQRQQNQPGFQTTGAGYIPPNSFETSNPLYSNTSASASGGTAYAGFGQGAVGAAAVDNFYGNSTSAANVPANTGLAVNQSRSTYVRPSSTNQLPSDVCVLGVGTLASTSKSGPQEIVCNGWAYNGQVYPSEESAKAARRAVRGY